jgi:predicted nucleotidyltransferase
VLLLHEDILLAYLYGSYIDGGWKSTSDIDVGIVVRPSAMLDHWYSIKIKNELEDALEGNYIIDLRILNDRSPQFQYNVIFNHPRILIRDEQFRVEFECKVLMIWYDLQPSYEQFYSERNEVLNRI